MNKVENNSFITQHNNNGQKRLNIRFKNLMSAYDLFDEKKINEQTKVFLNNVREISQDIGKSLRQHCSLGELHINMGQLLFTKIENYAAQYLADNPNDEKFKKNWKEFRFNFAQHMSTDSQDFFKASKNCLIDLQEKLFAVNHFDPLIYKHELAKAQALKDIFAKVFEKDVRLLIAPVAVLAEISSFNQEGGYQIQTFLGPVIEANNILAKTISQNIPWVVDHCESLLAIHLTSSCGQVREAAQMMFNNLKELKNKILPNLQKMVIKSSHAKSNEKILESIHQFVYFSLIPQKGNSDNSQFFCEETKDTILKDYLFPTLSPFEDQSINLDIDDLKNYQIQLTELQKTLKNRQPWIDRAIEDIDQIIKFKQDQQKCIRILDAFFTTPYVNFFTTAQTCNQILLDPTSKRIAEKTTFVKTKTLTQEDTRDINALVAAINRSSAPESASKRKKNRKQESLPQKKSSRKKSASKRKNRETILETKTLSLSTKENTKNEIFVNQIEKTLKSSAIPQAKTTTTSILNAPKQISHLLANMAIFADKPLKKNAARHAHMYLEDLIVATRGLPQASTESSKLFYLIMIMQSAYFHIEQVLNYERLSNPDFIETKAKGHNLKTLLNEIGCKSIDEKLPLELYLANYWTRETYEQLTKRASWNLPGALNSIKAVYEGTAKKNVVKRIKTYCERVCQFTKQLPSLAENKTFNHVINPIESLSIEQTLKFEVEKCDKIKSACQNLLSDIPLFLEPTLKQAISHIELVKGCLQELNKEKISSASLSFLVRSLIFWENTILEEMLQVLHGLKTGILLQSHDIVELYTLATDEKMKSEQIEKFLHNHCNNVHNISRYPFAPHRNSEKIHRLILESECIRERPELATGYKLEKNITELNYIELKEQSNSEQIISKLRKHSDKVCQILEKVLSELNP